MGKLWLNEMITIIVPNEEGGGADFCARQLAQFWEKELGVPVAVENHPGKAGAAGASYFQQLPDDGRFVFSGIAEFLSVSIVSQKTPYSLDDFSPLAFLELDYDCLSVPDSSPYQTFSDLSSAILENPNRIRVSGHPGAPSDIILDFLSRRIQWKVKNVFCEGAAIRQKALAEGAIDFCVGAVTSALRNKERCLVLYRNERLPMLPNVPSLGEVLGERIPIMGTSRFIAARNTLKIKHPKRFQKLVETLEKTRQRDDYRDALIKSQTRPLAVYFDQQDSERVLRDLYEDIAEYKNSLVSK